MTLRGYHRRQARSKVATTRMARSRPEGEEGIEDPHRERVDPAAVVAGDEPQRDPDDAADDDDDDRADERGAALATIRDQTSAGALVLAGGAGARSEAERSWRSNAREEHGTGP
jgi:hypothetical protein